MTHVANATEVPINIVGSSIFGRYPKISLEKTYNMFISDDWLVNYPGFKKVREVATSGQGRGLFHSIRGDFLLAVIDAGVYKINATFIIEFIGNIDTVRNEVSIAENLVSQICIVDGDNAYIFNYDTGALTKQTLTFAGNAVIPNYVEYHNTFFLIASSPLSTNPQNWYAATPSDDPVDPNTIEILATNQFAVQTKPDFALAIKRLPGKGNNIIVLGSSVAEIWTQVGGLENYRRIQSYNIDSGVVSVHTIAASEEMVCWLAQNENNSPVIMVSNGGEIKRISTDGIDHVLQSLKRPDISTAFFFRHDGHLFYQITFFNAKDNLSLFYDFNTGKFFHTSDEDLNFHPARQVVYFNELTFFISINDQSLFKMGTDFISYDYEIDPNAVGEVIPRIRICKSVRKKNNERFRNGKFSFWLEQGSTDFFLLEAGVESCDGEIITEDDNNIVTEAGDRLLTENGVCTTNLNRPAVDLSFSKNGNASFSNIVRRQLNAQAVHRNQIEWHRMGQANEITFQLMFWGLQRFVAQDGVLELY